MEFFGARPLILEKITEGGGREVYAGFTQRGYSEAKGIRSFDGRAFAAV